MLTADVFLITLLIVVANGSPIVARQVLKKRFDTPLDGGRLFWDKRPVLGASKTWRGLLAAIVCTALVAELVGYGYLQGATVAVGAMVGDILASFTKRRLGLETSSMAPLLDQVPESLIPVLLLMQVYQLSWLDVTLIVISFIVIELLLSRLLYMLGIRRHPY